MNTDSARTCQQCGRPTEGRICAHCAVRNALDPASDEDLTRFGEVPGEGTPDAGEKHFGPYRVLRVLGEGGFGTVYLALQTKPIRRHVALKVLKKGIGSGKHLLARFELERQALARMDHPSICRVYDAGESACGEPYFAMEVVNGRPINRYCRETRLPLPKLLPLFREVCSAVEHAHQRGVIHRDLKPSNILITERDGEPHPVVIDFGIAKAMEPLLETDTILTLSFQIIGTPVYMSPEQAVSGGHDADVRSDVYALGTVLYELLTGNPPISMEEMRKVGISAALRMICEADTPPPSSRLTAGGETPAGAETENQTRTISARRLRGDLDWITMRALAKDRERRYQSARDFSDDLGRFAEGMPVLAGPPGLLYRGRKFARRHPAGVAAAVAALALGAFGWGAREVRAAGDARAAKERLLEADQGAAPFAIAEASPHLARLRTALRNLSADTGAPLQARINAALALATGDKGEIPRLCDLLLGEGAQVPSPDQAGALRAGIARAPDSVPASLAGRALQIARNPVEPRDRRLCATALLVGADPGGAVWGDLAPEVARLTCGAGAVAAIRWTPVLQPIATRLLRPAEEVFAGEPDSPPGICAAILLGEFQRGNADALAELAARAAPAQFQPLAAALIACGKNGHSAASRLLAGDASADGTTSEAQRDESALRQARGAMLVLLAGEGHSVWPLLHRKAWGDPRLRTFVIHAFEPYGIPVSVPASRLAQADDPTERAALLLALGGYRREEVGPALLASTVEAVRGVYRSDPSAEVHSASEWLLRAWGEALPPVVALPAETAPSAASPSWTRDAATGLDFAVFRGPITFPMGSPATEPGRFSDEFPHEATIPQSFSLATKVLTFAEIDRFLPDFLEGRAEAPAPDFPGRHVSLYEARKLCNLLSEKAGIAEDQWCYTAGDAPISKENITALAGYRFPTESEWEYACRGGSSAPRPYGYAESLLPEYACLALGGGGGMRPPGSKRPNGFGLFDMLGNVQNFVEGVYGPYPGDSGTSPLAPELTIGLNDGTYDTPSGVVLRGQHDWVRAPHFRSAARSSSFFPEVVPVYTAGIRLARTIFPDSPES